MDTKNTNLTTKLHHTRDDHLFKDEDLSVYHLVYGFKIDHEKLFDNPKELKNFEKSIPKPFGLYGNPSRRNWINDDDTWVIGYKFGEVKGLYENLHFTYKNELQLARPVTESVVKMFKKQYPDKEGDTFGLLDNVRIGNRAFGNLMYGYWVDLESQEPGSDYPDTYLDELECGLDGITANFPAHGLQNQKYIFIGVDIERFFCDEPEQIGDFLTKVYKSSPKTLASRDKLLDVLAKTLLVDDTLNKSENPKIFDKDLIILSKKPMLAFIPIFPTDCS